MSTSSFVRKCYEQQAASNSRLGEQGSKCHSFQTRQSRQRVRSLQNNFHRLEQKSCVYVPHSKVRLHSCTRKCLARRVPLVLHAQANGEKRETYGFPQDDYAMEYNPREYTNKEQPDVILLTPEERKYLLPGSATGSQYMYYFGGVDTTLRRLSASLAMTFVVLNVSNLLAVPVSLYWLWSPVALAARRNAGFRKYPYCGLWRATVLEVSTAWVEPRAPTDDRYFDIFFGLKGDDDTRAGRMLRILLGDDSGARLNLEVPFKKEHRRLRVGEEAEMVVVGEEKNLRRFRALREAYLPQSRLWISEYPFCERNVFFSICDAIEEEDLH